MPDIDLDVLADLGWWYHLITVLVVAIDGLIPVVPGELLVISSGVLARAGELSIWASLATAWLGIVCGDLLVYSLFRYQFTSALLRSRWGTRLRDQVDHTLAKAGPAPGFVLLFVLRFVSGGRTASMAAAGMVAMPWRKLLVLSLTGSATWSVYMVGLGLVTGTAERLPLWVSALLGLGLGLLIGLGVAAALWVRRRCRPDTDR